MNRRIFLAIALLLISFMVIIVAKKANTENTLQKKVVVPVLDQEDTINMSKFRLNGKKLGDLYIDYLGLPHSSYSGNSIAVPKKHAVNFSFQLNKMWEKKKAMSLDNNVVQETAEILCQDYQNKTLMTTEQFVWHVDSITSLLYRSIDWSIVAKEKNLTPKELSAVKKIAEGIRGKEIVAYGLTELMPTSNGTTNVRVLNLLLQNAGKEYLESIPALGDELTSFGLFQFTQYAVFDTPKEKRGASIINQALPSEMKIPGSTSKLRGDDHYKAAYLFAIENLASLANMGYDVEKLGSDDVVSFIAMAHHSPKHARKWYLGTISSKFWKERLEEYKKKTKNNFKSLKTITVLERFFFNFKFGNKKTEEGCTLFGYLSTTLTSTKLNLMTGQSKHAPFSKRFRKSTRTTRLGPTSTLPV